MKKSPLAYAAAATCVIGVIGVLLLSLVGGVSAVATITLLLTGAAATAAIIGTALTWVGKRNQEQMACDIRRLAELTESSLEEARAQRPDPVVRFLFQGKAAEAMTATRIRPRRSINVDEIIEIERRAALGTLPPSPPAKPPTPVDERLARLAEQFSSLFGQGPVTEAERKAFADSVDDYCRRLRVALDTRANLRARGCPTRPRRRPRDPMGDPC